MSPTSTAEPRSYRHEALLYDGDDEFLAGTVDFVLDGLEAGQPVLVVLPPARGDLLRHALGGAAAEAAILDMTGVGRNPARLVPVWREFVETGEALGRPVRGIGEPVHPARSPQELVECRLHEALLNLAVAPDTPFWLRCPYDVGALPAPVVAEVYASHAVVADATGDLAGSPSYAGVQGAAELFANPLPAPPARRVAAAFGPHDLDRVRAAAARGARDAGVPDERVEDLALAVHEIATNSVMHGGGTGELALWEEPAALVCEVRDGGRIEDLLVGRRQPPLEATGGRGLWLANQLCDLVQVRSSSRGTVVRITTRL